LNYKDLRIESLIPTFYPNFNVKMRLIHSVIEFSPHGEGRSYLCLYLVLMEG